MAEDGVRHVVGVREELGRDEGGGDPDVRRGDRPFHLRNHGFVALARGENERPDEEHASS
jgi:hypothetical protein